MELVVEFGENLIFDKLYSNYLPFLSKGSLLRDSITLWTLSTAGGLVLYFFVASAIFFTYFDKNLMKHPKYLPNQIQREISMAFWQAFWGPVLMLPFWLPEINGYSYIYHDVNEYGYAYMALSIVLFLVISDFAIYWIHRLFHHPLVYSWLHKPHHTWKISTPFSGFAFHPLGLS